MNSPALIYAFRWFIWETIRQALASKIFWISLVVIGMCVIFCLGISIEGGENLRPEGDFLYSKGGKQPLVGPNPHPGKMNLLFGAMRVYLHRDGEAEIHFLQVILATWVAGAAGIIFFIVGTAGFLPEFLQPSTAAVLLAKPIPRWLFITGKYVGVVALVSFQTLLFFGLTWLALGLRTGFWTPGYLAGIPLFILHFATIYAFSVFLAVATRSTIACVVGSILFWFLCLAMNYARHSFVSMPELFPEAHTPPVFLGFVVDLGYWLLPKPADQIIFLEYALDASREKITLASLPEFATAWKNGEISPAVSCITSLFFCPLMMVLAGWQLKNTDY